MTAQTKPKTRMARRDRDVIRTSVPAQKKAATLRLPRLTRITDQYVDATVGTQAGFSTFKLETGDVTYRAITWGIVCTGEIVGVTLPRDGKHYMRAEKLKDYIGEVRLTANGTDMQSLSQEELETRNSYKGITFGPHYTGFAFPGSNAYELRQWLDAFALGTQGMKNLVLGLKATADFDPATMEIVCMPHAVDMQKPVGFTFTTDRSNQTFASAGTHTYYDLPIGDDVADIWVKGEGISHIRLEVDGDVLFDMDRMQYESYLIANGRNPQVLGGEWFLDVHCEGSPRSIAALDRAAERKRDARIKLELTTRNASTNVEFLVTHADLYARIR